MDGEKHLIVSAQVLLGEICRLIPFPAKQISLDSPFNEGAKRQRTDLVSDGDDEKLIHFTYMRDGKEGYCKLLKNTQKFGFLT